MCLSWWRRKPSFAHASAASVRGFVDPTVSSQPVDSDTHDGRHGSDHHPLGISYVIIGGNRALVVPRCEKSQCDSISSCCSTVIISHRRRLSLSHCDHTVLFDKRYCRQKQSSCIAKATGCSRKTRHCTRWSSHR